MLVLSRLSLAVGFCLVALAAEATTLKIDYRITLAGLTIGTADYAGTFEGDRYDMKITGQLTGLAGAMSGGGQGGASSSGTLVGTRVVPGGFSAMGKSGSSERTVRMGVSGGNVVGISIEPPFEPRPDRVPLTDANKRGIIDPLSGLVTVATSQSKLDEAQNCNRTIPVFDGTQRFNILLSYAETRAVEKPGYSGKVLVCNVRYVPIAGHRTERPSVKFMAENRDISVWLAPVAGTRVLVPLRISVRTQVGTSVIEADKWTVR